MAVGLFYAGAIAIFASVLTIIGWFTDNFLWW